MTDDESAALEVRARLDRLPTSRFAWKLLLLLVPVWVLESYDIGTIGTTVAVVKALWQPSGFELGLLAVSSTLAIALGLVPSGRLVDRLGRRKVLLGGVVWFTAFTIVAGLAPNIWVLIVLRFIAGLALGAVFPLPYVYLAEFMSPGLRARFVGYLNGVLTAAYIIPPVTAIYLLSQFDDGVAWRLLHIVSAVGIVYAVAVFKFLPESPRWLASQGRGAEALAIVSRIEESVTVSGRSLLPVHFEALDALTSSGDEKASRRPALDIFRPPLLRRTIVVWLMFFGTLPLFYVVLAFAPTLMVDNGYKLTNSLAFVAGLQLTGGIGGLVQGLLSDKLGRRPLIAGYGALSTVGLVLLASGQSTFVLLLASFLVGFFGLGIFPVAKLYIAEQYPVELRGIGTSSTEAFGRLFGGVAFASLVPVISLSIGTSGVIWTVCVLTGLTTVLPVLLFGRETRGIDIDDDAVSRPSVRRTVQS
jgi:putative MFS transporter